MNKFLPGHQQSAASNETGLKVDAVLLRPHTHGGIDYGTKSNPVPAIVTVSAKAYRSLLVMGALFKPEFKDCPNNVNDAIKVEGQHLSVADAAAAKANDCRPKAAKAV